MRNTIFLMLIGIVFAVAACTTKPEQYEIELYIEELVQARIDKIVKDKKQDCKNVVVSEAATAVDSLLLNELSLDLLDTVEMIDKPFQIDRPSYIRDLDTSKVKPLF